jgi:hypothetical protein
MCGSSPTRDELVSYLEAYFGDQLSPDCRKVVDEFLVTSKKTDKAGDKFWNEMVAYVRGLFVEIPERSDEVVLMEEASSIVRLLARSTEEIDSLVHGLSGGYIKPAPGGDTGAGRPFHVDIRGLSRRPDIGVVVSGDETLLQSSVIPPLTPKSRPGSRAASPERGGGGHLDRSVGGIGATGRPVGMRTIHPLPKHATSSYIEDVATVENK